MKDRLLKKLKERNDKAQAAIFPGEFFIHVFEIISMYDNDLDLQKIEKMIHQEKVTDTALMNQLEISLHNSLNDSYDELICYNQASKVENSKQRDCFKISSNQTKYAITDKYMLLEGLFRDLARKSLFHFDFISIHAKITCSLTIQHGKDNLIIQLRQEGQYTAWCDAKKLYNRNEKYKIYCDWESLISECRTYINTDNYWEQATTPNKIWLGMAIDNFGQKQIAVPASLPEHTFGMRKLSLGKIINYTEDNLYHIEDEVEVTRVSKKGKNKKLLFAACKNYVLTQYGSKEWKIYFTGRSGRLAKAFAGSNITKEITFPILYKIMEPSNANDSISDISGKQKELADLLDGRSSLNKLLEKHLGIKNALNKSAASGLKNSEKKMWINKKYS